MRTVGEEGGEGDLFFWSDGVLRSTHLVYLPYNSISII